MNICKKYTFIVCIALCVGQPSIALELNSTLPSSISQQCRSLWQKTRNFFIQHPILVSTSTSVALAALLALTIKIYQEHRDDHSKALIHTINNIIDSYNISDPNNFPTIKKEQLTPLINLIKNGKVEPDTAGNKGITPLYIMVKANNADYVKQLVIDGANRNKLTEIMIPEGDEDYFRLDTPFTAARRIPTDNFFSNKHKGDILAAFGDNSLQQILLSSNNAYNENIKKLVDYCNTSASDKQEAKKFIHYILKNHFVSINTQLPGLKNKTLFHIAAETNDQELGQWLYNNKANTLIQDNNNNTVLDIASDMLKKLPENQREKNFFWILLNKEQNRLQAEQRKENQSPVPSNVMPHRADGSSPFDIIDKTQVLAIE